MLSLSLSRLSRSRSLALSCPALHSHLINILRALLCRVEKNLETVIHPLATASWIQVRRRHSTSQRQEHRVGGAPCICACVGVGVLCVRARVCVCRRRCGCRGLHCFAPPHT